MGGVTIPKRVMVKLAKSLTLFPPPYIRYKDSTLTWTTPHPIPTQEWLTSHQTDIEVSGWQQQQKVLFIKGACEMTNEAWNEDLTHNDDMPGSVQREVCHPVKMLSNIQTKGINFMDGDGEQNVEGAIWAGHFIWTLSWCGSQSVSCWLL